MMTKPTAFAESELTRLLAVMVRLRDPACGCPWDQVQTFATIAPYTIEEAYEVADAIARGDMAALPDELGDLLLQVVYHARIAEEAGLFGFADVARCVTDKMIRRHPHVFPEAGAPLGWEAQKQIERTARNEHGTLAGIPAALPALSRALKLTKRAARVGFDWADADQVLEKLQEEIAELRAELAEADPARLADELGDVLFVAANLARKLGLHELFEFVTPLLGDPVELGPFRLSFAAMNHPVPTFAVLVDDGHRLVYSGDTGESDALVHLATGADALLCEASFSAAEEYVPDLHLTGRQAGEHAQRAGVGKLIITHVQPWNSRDAAVAEARAVFGGPVTAARPGAVYEI